jgi:Spy/CpxP family protein refolding chaperone
MGAGAQHPWGGGKFADGGREQRFAGGERGFGRGAWEGGRGHMGMRHERGGERVLRLAENPRMREYLGLTEDQAGRLHKIGVDAEKASVQTRADLELRHIELRELLRGDNPDHDAVMQKLDEVTALQGKMEKQRVETLLAARAVLTPDQTKKLKALRENPGFGGPGHGPMMERRGVGHTPGHAAGHGASPAPGASTPKATEPAVQ